VTINDDIEWDETLQWMIVLSKGLGTAVARRLYWNAILRLVSTGSMNKGQLPCCIVDSVIDTKTWYLTAMNVL